MTNCTTVNPSIGVSTGSIKQAEPGRRWTLCWTKLLRFQLFREKGVGTRRRLNSCLRLYINGSSGSCTSKHKHTRGVSEQFPRFLSQGYLPFYLSLFLPFPLFLCLFNLYTAYSASLEKVDETALIKKSNEVRATEVLGVLGPDGRDVHATSSGRLHFKSEKPETCGSPLARRPGRRDREQVRACLLMAACFPSILPPRTHPTSVDRGSHGVWVRASD